MAALSAVVFDLDGTLVDTEEVLDGCISEATLSLTGVSPTHANLAAVRGFADEGPGSWPERLLSSLPPPSPSAPLTPSEPPLPNAPAPPTTMTTT